MNECFLDKKEKRPKVMKNHLTKYDTFNADKKNIKTRIFGSIFNNNNNNKENCKNVEIEKPNLINKFSSEIYQANYKRKYNLNNKSLNLIIEENHKLNNLLRKIPSNKDNKVKGSDLINYIYKLRKKDNNIKYMKSCKYKTNNNIKFGIYPVNEWEQISELKFKTFE